MTEIAHQHLYCHCANRVKSHLTSLNKWCPVCVLSFGLLSLFHKVNDTTALTTSAPCTNNDFCCFMTCSAFLLAFVQLRVLVIDFFCSWEL